MSLFQDPIRWSGFMVSSWFRFSCVSLFFVFALAFAVYSAALDGWRSALGITFFLAGFQLSMLYALRRLFLKASGRDVEGEGFKWHWLGMVILVIAGWGVCLCILFALPRAV
ncbi:hypothetical protein [Undibacterium sp. Di24W]|uniref:hypothetical protein n=1 Tax=Undibacterium sp. Di24W TaxID=3413033 RepID=UPI003BF3ECA9